jgi:hypothetical protein
MWPVIERFLSWVRISQYTRANSRDWQSTFAKVLDMQLARIVSFPPNPNFF